jgi:formylmethanofuran dehydrogenase subunit C
MIALMSLTLTYHAKTTVPVEVEGVIPERLRDKSLAEIERLEAYCGNRQISLADLFAISGDPSDGRMDFEGDLRGVHYIGYGMTAGEIHVHGNAGRHVGGEMSGGMIRVEGDAGDWVGGEMHGGLIQVNGSAGHLIGAAYRGSKRGMTDGTILIGGDVGNEIGAAMRRGMLAVAGSCGDAAGFNMFAGSIFVFGSCGIRIGAGMRRGTIGLFGEEPPKLLPTFRRAGRYRPLFLRLVFGELTRCGFPVDDGLLEGDLSLHHGDLVAAGKGEVWMRGN